MDVNGKIYKEFLNRIHRHKEQNSQDKIKKQHDKGKLHARERIHLLFDKNSFEELDAFVTSATPDSGFGKIDEAFGDGVVIGYGRINGRLVYIYSQDFTVMGGSLGSVHAKKIVKVQDLALRVGAPIIGLIDSGGARIQEGVASLSGYASIFHRNVQSSGIIPQISVILGPAAGGAVYSPALTDFVFMTKKTSYMFVTGPDVVREVLNEEVSFDDLGGAEIHARKSGVAHFIYEDEENTLLGVKKLLSFFPSNNLENPPFVDTKDDKSRVEEKLRAIVPDDPNKPYDIKQVIDLIIDKDSFFEVSEHFASNLVVGFARLNGKAIGIVANQPKILAGVLDINSSLKGARFIRFCDVFNIPILTLEDVPGFLPGLDQEHNGLIKHGAKLLFAYSEATVPKITVILRKSYGGAFCVMNSKNLGGDYNYAWPTAEIAVMGPEGAVSILYRREIQQAEDPKQLKKELAAKYRQEIANPYIADEKGYIDEVIDPAETRKKLIVAFESLENKHIDPPSRKHANIPL
ncbi:MAG: methylmalonyl-CoA carboxyltransferase [Bacteroidetes bacterium GWC2_33_15]|nr:MAG: methylmalonyl-CoA carboxyltransferase [Bacteroidetes bacterium GWA2_33_15]OFX50680.1 MAG: methylmalonyl-CoA carboxyltransferase [Bacteroidetes bacterium GWC2_33_15]OFX63224.1 MAG: methylmalonyl-CoA carboxyltransferase [Bacteroidetes bacterium GWB2_32_14]OFX69829.1 MAG: methylmalonyl-CoA carboxyltransferase [Bacteroidetes bacterium GWD2_33_33]HAN19874.1 methylmalonyl-CoA carboxyltransferase [Bacteroidales bacterium]